MNSAISLLLCATAGVGAHGGPKIVAYSAAPNTYFDEHAPDAAELYDGFFFVVGSWDEGVARCLGVGEDPPADPSWRENVKGNIARLRETGATENLLGVSFGESEPWPSPETLLSDEFTAKMARHFGAVGQAAKDLQFRGVSIDVEYPYKRYLLDHPIYTYDKYTADDLVMGAAKQGRACMSALLDAFPDAVIFLLPGELGGSPIVRSFTLAMFDVMAERDAPGGLHLGYERSYCLWDPATQVAIPRVGDCAAETELKGEALAYWKRRCTTAPGVWPLHMVETGGPGYPVRPWAEELAELRQQMGTLHGVAKQYIWSYSGAPVWLPADAELRKKYGLGALTFDGADEAIRGWHDILKADLILRDPRLLDLIRAVREFDAGRLNAAAFCAQFATPASWMVLGYLSNPFIAPGFSAPLAATEDIDFAAPVQGRDGLVRWFPFNNYEPTGHIRIRNAFGYRATDKCSVHLVCTMTAAEDVEGFVWANFDDGGLVRVDDVVVLDRLAYPERGHGLQYKDRYMFEYSAPVKIAKGPHRLSLTSVNSHGVWGINLRFGDKDQYPLKGLSFSIP